MFQRILKITQKESILYGGGWGLISGLEYYLIAGKWEDSCTGLSHNEVHIFWKILLLPAWIIDKLFIEGTTFGLWIIPRTGYQYEFYFNSMLVGGILGFVIIGAIKMVAWFIKRK